MRNLNVKISLLSPLLLGNGGGSVYLDTDTCYDKYGQPYFPGKRFRGLLLESALELAEMGAEFTEEQIRTLFGANTEQELLRIENFYPARSEEYQKSCAEWEYLKEEFPGLFTKEKVLDSYTKIYYQTAVDSSLEEETGCAKGVAQEGSLRNLRAVNAGVSFYGKITILEKNKKLEGDYAKLLQEALLNLRFAGAKRNRGFGNILCSTYREESSAVKVNTPQTQIQAKSNKAYQKSNPKQKKGKRGK